VFGAKSPLAIAAGMLGQNAFRGGAAIYILAACGASPDTFPQELSGIHMSHS
jgi:hypothetical protein